MDRVEKSSISSHNLLVITSTFNIFVQVFTKQLDYAWIECEFPIHETEDLYTR